MDKFEELKPSYFVLLTIVTVVSTITVGLLTKLFGRKK